MDKNKKNGENKRLHLRMIEDVISRMGSNSFLIKGWSLTAMGGLVTLYIANMQKKWAYYLLFLCLFVCVLFWMSDAYYLLLERKFRKLYDEVAQKDEEEIDFSMKVDSHEKFAGCLFRPIFLKSYLIIFIALLVLIYIFKPR